MASKGYRYDRIPGADNSAAISTKQIQNPAYATTIALANLDTEHNTIDFKKLTGDLSVTADVANAYTGDRMTCLFAADSSGDRTVTFSTGFAANGTLTVLDDAIAVVEFVFTTTGLWLEVSRFISAELA